MANVPLTPGNKPVFTVTPTFSGAPFATVIAQAFVNSSDNVNFPVELVATDPTGRTFQGTVSSTLTAAISVSITWGYHNPDGTLALVSTQVQLEPAPADDITGGVIAQTA